jgi:hypothetical protein
MKHSEKYSVNGVINIVLAVARRKLERKIVFGEKEPLQCVAQIQLDISPVSLRVLENTPSFVMDIWTPLGSLPILLGP